MFFDVSAHPIIVGLLQILAASGGTFWLLSTRLGERWLSHRFDQKLAQVKHDQNEKIENLKAQLSNLTDRGRHSNEREFSALTEIWELLVEAYLSTNASIASLLEYPDMTRLSDDEVKSFLDSSSLSDKQRTFVFESRDRNNAFSQSVTLNQINKAGSDLQSARIALRKKGIFVPPAISLLVSHCLDTMTGAWVERRLQFQHRDFRGNKSTEFLGNGDKMISTLGEAVRVQLAATS